MVTALLFVLNKISFFSGGVFTFTFQIAPLYPHEAPKVKCKTKVSRSLSYSFVIIVSLNFFCNYHVILWFSWVISYVRNYLQVYHPNIDLEGSVCLNILREDWKPVLNINTVIYGLYHLFTVRLFHDLVQMTYHKHVLNILPRVSLTEFRSYVGTKSWGSPQPWSSWGAEG